jgi:hypothetical protein
MAMNVCGWHNSVYVPSKFEKFPDGNDNIRLGGFSPDNIVRGADIVFVASLHSNNATMQVMHAVQVLLESFINSMTLVVPFYPFGTMVRAGVSVGDSFVVHQDRGKDNVFFSFNDFVHVCRSVWRSRALSRPPTRWRASFLRCRAAGSPCAS